MEDKDKKGLITLKNSWMKASGEIFKLVLNREVKVSNPKLDEISAEESLKQMDAKNSYVYPITITSGIIGKCFIIFQTKTLSAIVDLIMGGDGAETIKELDEVHLGILEEVINQIIGALISMLSEKLSRKLNVKIHPPEVPSVQTMGGGEVFQTVYDLKIENLSDSRITVIFPNRFASELMHQIADEMSAISSMKSASRKKKGKGSGMKVRKASFPSFNSKKPDAASHALDKVKDVSVSLSVVLGRTKINVKDLFGLSPGAVLELDNLPDDPVEIFINDKFLGYGEIIIADNNYGVRVIDVNKK